MIAGYSKAVAISRHRSSRRSSSIPRALYAEDIQSAMLLVSSSQNPGTRGSTECLQRLNLKPTSSTFGVLLVLGSIHMFPAPVQPVLFHIPGQ